MKNMEGFTGISGSLPDPKKFKQRPRYTMVFHDVREKLGLSLNTYVVIDSIHKLSTSDRRYPYCVISKKNLGSFLQLTDRTVFRALNEAEELELIERTEHGIRTTDKWVRLVELYDTKGS